LTGGPGADSGPPGYFFSRFQTLAIRPLPALVVKSVGRSAPAAAKQNVNVSPSIA
jgi:hypothetical protein